jgi:hypothetical protein
MLAPNHATHTPSRPGCTHQKIHPQKKLLSENLSEPVIPYLWVLVKTDLWGKRFQISKIVAHRTKPRLR